MLWRILFIFYAIVLTVSTHWPRLNLGSVGGRSPDKLLHFVAFGMLTLMLWRTRWFRSRCLVFILAMAWTGLDEISQNIAFVERTASWHDFIASSLGVSVAALWLWALGPVGRAGYRLTLDRWNSAAEIVLRSAPGLALMGVGGIFGAIAGYFVDMLYHMIDGGETTSDARLLTMLTCAFVGAHSVFIVLARRAQQRIVKERWCLACHQVIAAPEIDITGHGTCVHCAAKYLVYQWLSPASIPPEKIFKLTTKPIAIAIGLMALGFVAFVVLLRLARSSGGVHAIMRSLNHITPELMFVIDLAFVLATIAVAVRVYRRSVANLHDAQGSVCMSCGHDLRATPADLGMGICGECGAGFVRLGEESFITETSSAQGGLKK